MLPHIGPIGQSGHHPSSPGSHIQLPHSPDAVWLAAINITVIAAKNSTCFILKPSCIFMKNLLAAQNSKTAEFQIAIIWDFLY
jgi:hypothetical protein